MPNQFQSRAAVSLTVCGRFTHLYTWRQLHRLLSLHTAPPEEELPFRYNVAPTQLAPVAMMAEGGEPAIDMYRWGLVPWWSKDESAGSKMINARAETVATNAAFREAFQQRRCLVPASGFYEWQKPEGAARKRPWYIKPVGDDPLCFAGLWERWKGPEGGELRTFTIITTTPNEAMQPIHSRMPVIVAPSEYHRWLEPGSNPAELRPLLAPCAAAMLQAYPVGTRVNSPRHDDALCIEREEPSQQQQAGLW